MTIHKAMRNYQPVNPLDFDEDAQLSNIGGSTEPVDSADSSAPSFDDPHLDHWVNNAVEFVCSNSLRLSHR